MIDYEPNYTVHLINASYRPFALRLRARERDRRRHFWPQNY